MQLKQLQDDLKSQVARSNQLQQELSSREAFWSEHEKALLDTVQQLEKRCKDLQEQNTLLHEEADKVLCGVCMCAVVCACVVCVHVWCGVHVCCGIWDVVCTCVLWCVHVCCGIISHIEGCVMAWL